MSLVFSDKLLDFFRDFYNATGGLKISIFEPPIRVAHYTTILNYYNCIAYPSVDMDNVLCKVIRNKSREVDNLCVECDECAFRKCTELGDIHVYRCHLGLIEGLIPVPVNGKNRALIFIGQIYDGEKNEEKFKALYQKLHKIDPKAFTPADYDFYRNYFYGLYSMSEYQFRALCSTLKFVANRLHADRLVIDTEENTDELIKTYIDRNIGTRITSEKICEDLGISRSSLYRRIKLLYGLSFTDYVNSYKINKAASLLKEGKYTIKQVALMVGYEDISYFSRLFKHYIGMPPKAFKAEMPE